MITGHSTHHFEVYKNVVVGSNTMMNNGKVVVSSSALKRFCKPRTVTLPSRILVVKKSSFSIPFKKRMIVFLSVLFGTENVQIDPGWTNARERHGEAGVDQILAFAIRRADACLQK
jgi:hypothetical protein